VYIRECRDFGAHSRMRKSDERNGKRNRTRMTKRNGEYRKDRKNNGMDARVHRVERPKRKRIRKTKEERTMTEMTRKTI